MNRLLKNIFGVLYQNLELILWIAVIVVLFLPMPSDGHFSLCPLHNAGFEHCPGCGLGRSANMALHGDIINSLRMHPLGIFTIIVIVFRIFALLSNIYKPTKF
jgi:hypothetical protein